MAAEEMPTPASLPNANLRCYRALRYKSYLKCLSLNRLLVEPHFGQQPIVCQAICVSSHLCVKPFVCCVLACAILCVCLLPFMASQVSVSEARRLRAAAVTRNLYVKARATVPADHTLQNLVQMVADIHSLLCWSCRGVVSSPEVWAESAMPVGKVGVDMEAGLCDGNVVWKC